MNEIYFDNSATTKPSEACIRAINETLMCSYANPSSLHSAGNDARKKVEDARAAILATLSTDVQKHRLIFTASGSEANNLALLGTARSKKWHFRPKVLVGDGEHPSVTNCAKQLEREGFEIIYISTRGGEIDMQALAEAADERVVLCSFMCVNNETGAIYDVKRAFNIVRAKAPDAVCHTDCVQAYLKMRLTVNSLGADLISISAHKIHGPKGIGALVIEPNILKRRLLSPVIYGGGQELELRAGTENSAYIVGFAAAALESRAELARFCENSKKLYEYITASVTDTLDGFCVNAPKVHVPHIISITTPNIKSETMLHFLSGEGIYISSGSACSSHSKHTSPALAAFGLSADEADRTIRVSLSRDNTPEEAQAFISALKKGADTLVGYKKAK